MADITMQLRLMPQTATHIVVSIGGNDAIGASRVLEEGAANMAEALEKLAVIRDRFDRSYGTMIDLVLERSLPVAFCTIYEPRFPDPRRRRAAATARTVLNDVITRQVFRKRASLIDLRIICDQDTDFANSIEPSATGGVKIAEAIARFTRADRPTATIFGNS